MDRALQEKNLSELMEKFKHRCALNPAHKAEVFHHIVPKSVLPKDMREIDNLIPICMNCHVLVHLEGAYTYRQQFQDKLRNGED